MFSQSLFIQVFVSVFHFEFVLFLNCQHCSVHTKFCKEDKTCSVVSTLNTNLANKRFRGRKRCL